MRPRKEDAERRGEIVRVRLTTVEAAVLGQRADAVGMTISDYIRSKIITDEDIQARSVSRRRQLPSDVAEAVRALSRIGTNIQALRVQALRDRQTDIAPALHEAMAIIVEVLKRLKE